jgi:VWFA-related protein
MTAWFGAAAAVLFLTAAKAEKKPPMPFLGETIEVSIVNLDVVVTDRDGNRVRGLTRSDFQIIENGKEQPLSHFAEYRSGAGEAGIDAAPQAPPPQQRTLVIFIEQFKLQDFRVNPFIESIKDLVRKTIRKGDRVSVIFYQRGPVIAVRPTDDIAAVEAALDNIGRACIGPMWDRTGTVASDVAGAKQFEATAAAMAASRGVHRPPLSNEFLKRHATALFTMQAVLEANRLASALDVIVEGLAGVEGKKMLLLATRRFGEFVGADYYYAAGADFVPIDKRFELDNMPRVRHLIEIANAAGVTVYPLFPSGNHERSSDPDAPDIGAQVVMNEMATLTSIAEKTGGLTTWSTAEIAKLLPRVADDVTDYYSLAYRATTRRHDETRSVEVRTKDRNLRVRTRRQFVDRSDDSRMHDRVVAALHDHVKESPMTVTASVGQRSGARRDTIPLKIRIPIGQLTMLPHDGKHAGAFSVYVATGSERGETSDVTQKTQPFEIRPSDLERARASDFTYDFELLVNKGADKVAVGVFDEVSKSYALLTLPITER